MISSISLTFSLIKNYFFPLEINDYINNENKELYDIAIENERVRKDSSFK